MRIIVTLLCLGLMPAAAFAAELSPWFGGEGREPFQVPVSDGAQDETTTQSTSAAPDNCSAEHCPVEAKTARTTEDQAD